MVVLVDHPQFIAGDLPSELGHGPLVLVRHNQQHRLMILGGPAAKLTPFSIPKLYWLLHLQPPQQLHPTWFWKALGPSAGRCARSLFCRASLRLLNAAWGEAATGALIPLMRIRCGQSMV